MHKYGDSCTLFDVTLTQVTEGFRMRCTDNARPVNFLNAERQSDMCHVWFCQYSHTRCDLGQIRCQIQGKVNTLFSHALPFWSLYTAKCLFPMSIVLCSDTVARAPYINACMSMCALHVVNCYATGSAIAHGCARVQKVSFADLLITWTRLPRSVPPAAAFAAPVCLCA